MGLLGFVLAFFVLFGVLVVIGVRYWIRTEDEDAARRDEHLARADEVTAELFDGSPAVTYVPVDSSGGLPTERLVAAANDHGYRLTSETGRGMMRRVVFERR